MSHAAILCGYIHPSPTLPKNTQSILTSSRDTPLAISNSMTCTFVRFACTIPTSAWHSLLSDHASIKKRIHASLETPENSIILHFLGHLNRNQRTTTPLLYHTSYRKKHSSNSVYTTYLQKKKSKIIVSWRGKGQTGRQANDVTASPSP